MFGFIAYPLMVGQLTKTSAKKFLITMKKPQVVAVLLAEGIPIEGLPLLFALDRIFDMIRTALNITGDAACAVIVDSMVEETAETTAENKEA